MNDPVTQKNGSSVEEVRHPEHEVVVCMVGKEYFALPLDAMAEIYKSPDIMSLPLSPINTSFPDFPTHSRALVEHPARRTER